MKPHKPAPKVLDAAPVAPETLAQRLAAIRAVHVVDMPQADNHQFEGFAVLPAPQRALGRVNRRPDPAPEANRVQALSHDDLEKAFKQNPLLAAAAAQGRPRAGSVSSDAGWDDGAAVAAPPALATPAVMAPAPLLPRPVAVPEAVAALFGAQPALLNENRFVPPPRADVVVPEIIREHVGQKALEIQAFQDLQAGVIPDRAAAAATIQTLFRSYRAQQQYRNLQLADQAERQALAADLYDPNFRVTTQHIQTFVTSALYNMHLQCHTDILNAAIERFLQDNNSPADLQQLAQSLLRGLLSVLNDRNPNANSVANPLHLSEKNAISARLNNLSANQRTHFALNFVAAISTANQVNILRSIEAAELGAGDPLRHCSTKEFSLQTRYLLRQQVRRQQSARAAGTVDELILKGTRARLR